MKKLFVLLPAAIMLLGACQGGGGGDDGSKEQPVPAAEFKPEVVLAKDEEYQIPAAAKATFSSSDSAIASVSEAGLVKALAFGDASISVTEGDKTKTVAVYVRMMIADIYGLPIGNMTMFDGYFLGIQPNNPYVDRKGVAHPYQIKNMFVGAGERAIALFGPDLEVVNDLKIGDAVTVKGTADVYSGATQIQRGAIITKFPASRHLMPEAAVDLNLESAVDLCPENMGRRVIVTGKLEPRDQRAIDDYKNFGAVNFKLKLKDNGIVNIRGDNRYVAPEDLEALAQVVCVDGAEGKELTVTGFLSAFVKDLTTQARNNFEVIAPKLVTK